MEIDNYYYVKKFVKYFINKLGFEIISIKKSPNNNLLGLKNYPIRSIVDVGANIGQFAKAITTFFPEAEIYCVEPLPDVFHQLDCWARRQNGKVKTFNFGLGDSRGTSEMILHVDHNYSSSLLRTTDYAKSIYPQMKRQSTLTVNVTTLDSLVNDLSGPLVGDILIKLDVQGYEDRVIRGGVETFRKARACILEINLDHLYEYQADFQDLANLLHSLGYRYMGNLDQTYAGDGHVIFIDSVFIKH
jgi:FkbM family methyltransferase